MGRWEEGLSQRLRVEKADGGDRSTIRDGSGYRPEGQGTLKQINEQVVDEAQPGKH